MQNIPDTWLFMHIPSLHTVKLTLYGLLCLFRIKIPPHFFPTATELLAKNVLKEKIYSVLSQKNIS